MNWGAIRARLATACGWTPQRTGREITLRQLRALFTHWETTPPLVELAAGTLRAFGMLGAAPSLDVSVSDAAVPSNSVVDGFTQYTRDEVFGHLAAVGLVGH